MRMAQREVRSAPFKASEREEAQRVCIVVVLNSAKEWRVREDQRGAEGGWVIVKSGVAVMSEEGRAVRRGEWADAGKEAEKFATPTPPPPSSPLPPPPRDIRTPHVRPLST